MRMIATTLSTPLGSSKILASPPHRANAFEHDEPHVAFLLRSSHLDTDHRIRTQLSRGQLASFRRPTRPAGLILPDRQAHLATVNPPASTASTLVSDPAPTDLTRTGAISRTVPPVIRRYAPPSVAANEESTRSRQLAPATRQPRGSRSVPTRLPSCIRDRPLPPLPPPTLPRKPVPRISGGITTADQESVRKRTSWEERWNGAKRPSEVERELQNRLSFSLPELRDQPLFTSPTTNSPLSTPIRLITPSTQILSEEVRSRTDIPSAIRLAGQKLGDYEGSGDIYDELQAVLGARGLALNSAELAWDVSIIAAQLRS